jgi:hypothetical protein
MPDDYEERLRRSLRREGDQVHPSPDGLDKIRKRTKKKDSKTSFIGVAGWGLPIVAVMAVVLPWLRHPGLDRAAALGAITLMVAALAVMGWRHIRRVPVASSSRGHRWLTGQPSD